MRAITVTDDHQLELSDLPEPVPAEGEVLVDVIAAGVNRADLAQAAGHYPPPPGASELLGLEVSGHRRDTGEAVVALLAGGGYAEVVAVPEEQLLPAPSDLDLRDAAGLIEVAATVVSNLVVEADLQPGGGSSSPWPRLQGEPAPEPQTLLVHGGTGGIGSFALQFARALGLQVWTTVGSDKAVATARELGADLAWNRRTADVPAAVREAGGADVILDVVGGPTLMDNVSMLREHGRLVVIGTIGGPRGELDLGALMARRSRVIGTTLRSRSSAEKHLILQLTRELVWPMLEDGSVRVPVQAHVPMERAGEAHQVLQQGGHLGKVILDVRA
ncbi:NAD(P)H-quinone oxidoreductase [Brachybacterium endophyticum]|uniref:NAD(P)H-quinone oxidoreductase n=1 Tax=Brachybacterium endophyticum TaxID=2182385 RepID=A0A2U2RNX3_9MICO|nr:NAD(P)H-quinone oxidoreductase [Brachybacterium endophyticum]PWH07556.1 NAD(P)H-quinone oxidoreductase [Brachybacterium endophyticum]